jgi:hypothetical protein
MNCFSKKSPQIVYERDSEIDEYEDDKNNRNVTKDMVFIHRLIPMKYDCSKPYYRPFVTIGPYVSYTDKWHAYLGVTLEEASYLGCILPINKHDVFNIDLGEFGCYTDAETKCKDANAKLFSYICNVKQKQQLETRNKIMEIVM